MKKDNKYRNVALNIKRVKSIRINTRSVKVARKTINVEFD
jgi:hypothetical protein